jgi:hypothetical protein
MTRVIARRRFRVSIRSLMIFVALFALLFAPIMLMFRHFQAQVLLERMAAENARAQAESAIRQVRANQAAISAAKAKAAIQSETESEADLPSKL